MSLTSELKQATSPISTLLRKHFPAVNKVVKSARQRLVQANTIYPTGTVPWALIGTAFDYRLRFYFPQKKRGFMSLVAASGLNIACNEWLFFPPGREKVKPGDESRFLSVKAAEEFIQGFETFIKNTAPAGKRLAVEAENELLRYCIVLGMLDWFFRMGFDERSLLLNPQPKRTGAEMLAVAEEAWIEDLRNLSWSFYDQFQTMMGESPTLNPTFDGSALVGGADADFIYDRCLVDIKTTIAPFKDSSAIYQLLGYVLLDSSNEFELERVGVYLSRQQMFIEWSLDALMELASNGNKPNISELREEVLTLYSPARSTNSLIRNMKSARTE